MGSTSTADASPGSRPLVLFVEDDRDTLDLYVLVFQREGFDVVTADDGAAAIQQAAEYLPDVIVMDLALPQTDGWDATRQIKLDPRTAHIPVVACTAHAYATHLSRATEAGCDVVLTKPCAPEDIIREIRKVLHDKPVPRAR